MKLLPLLAAFALFGCAGRSALAPGGAASRTDGKNAAFARLQPAFEGNTAMLGSHFLAQLLRGGEGLALYLAILNPKGADKDFDYESSYRVNLAAVWPGGRQELLTTQKTLIAPGTLPPGSSKTGVLFYQDKPAPQYKLTITGDGETLEFTFDNKNI